MTFSVADGLLRQSTPAVRYDSRPALSPLVLVTVGTLLSIALSWSTIVVIWRTGTFFDTDDAMRMVQVRSWLAGQTWYDLAVHRLDPPIGVFMHWSRVVDVPLAILIRGFELFASASDAERLARIVFPLSLQAALIAAVVYAGRVLVGPVGALPAMLLAVTSAVQFGQFVPGRVDHHAPQITLLMLMAGCAAEAMLRARRSSAAWAAGAATLSLAISLENLPFIAILVTAMATTWIIKGESHAAMLRAFGFALAAAALLLFVATVGPGRATVVSTDAFSLPHVLGAVLGGSALALLTWLRVASPSLSRRAMASVIAGGAVLLALVVICPGVLGSPYGGLDPVVKEVWLSRVTEALPLSTAVRLHPQAGTLIVAPLLAGLVAMGLAVWSETGLQRGVWLTIGALTLAGLLGAFWEVRIISSATPLGLLGGVWAYARLARQAGAGATTTRAGLAAIGMLIPFSPMALVIVPMPAESATTASATASAELCREADHVSPLAALGPGLMFAPIDSGSHLLAHTALSVFGAPYHRNNAGNRLVIDGFSAEGAEAERIVKGSGARYVALCPGQVQADALTERNPKGLAAALIAGHTPAWLQKLDVPGTPYIVFAVR